MTSEIARCIAKINAYRNCGKPESAEQWFRTLANTLGFSHLLK